MYISSSTRSSLVVLSSACYIHNTYTPSVPFFRWPVFLVSISRCVIDYRITIYRVFSFSSFSDQQIDRHFRIDWPHAVVFCPNECGRKYQSKAALHNHLKYECGVDPQFRCEECGKLFCHKNNMKTHMGLVHKKILT